MKTFMLNLIVPKNKSNQQKQKKRKVKWLSQRRLNLPLFLKKKMMLISKNKAKFNHDFVKEFRDHDAEKNQLGTISDTNVQKVLLDFYFRS